MEKKIFSVVIIDDERYNLDRMEQFAMAHDQLSMLAGYCDPLLALDEILAKGQVVDFAFVDVNMPGMMGAELLPLIRHLVRFPVYTTGMSIHRSAYFDPKRDFYLLKPFGFEKFCSAVEGIIEGYEKSVLENALVVPIR
ncbi:MAG: response regulator [Pedobacter sp.]|nr:response regulator [Pedobacter sp.]